jgi:hypothetical protein
MVQYMPVCINQPGQQGGTCTVDALCSSTTSHCVYIMMQAGDNTLFIFQRHKADAPALIHGVTLYVVHQGGSLADIAQTKK